MNHPEKILRTLDAHLIHPTRLILYGRAALALGFPAPYPEFHTTMDVDAILPEVEMDSIEDDDSFWDAVEVTNQELHSSGLYLTHLFADSQIILSPNWLEHIIPIDLPGLRFLQLFRPSTPDLILTKMMRVDPQDRADIDFLLAHLTATANDISRLIEAANVPDIPEIHEAFLENSAWLKSRPALPTSV